MEKQEKFIADSEVKDVPRNIKIIETPTARFRIMYASHDSTQKAEEAGEAEGLILETAGGSYSIPQDAEYEANYLNINRGQYTELLKWARERKKPVFLVDTSEDAWAKDLQVALMKGESI